MEFNYHDFVKKSKALLVSPAGYGKTHTISESLKYTQEIQLILTHTHAGIASIKEKCSKLKIAPHSFHIETISGFAQKYVCAFLPASAVPSQNESNYHKILVQKAIEVFKYKLVQTILCNSYSGIFVDEYQDCSLEQHRLILTIANQLPVRVLGDPLQSIFSFNDTPVSFETNLSEFDVVPELDTPYRWFQDGNNSNLGNALKLIRQKLLNNEEINLSLIRDIEVELITNDSLFANQDYAKKLRNLIATTDSLLILTPNTPDLSNINARSKISNMFKLRLLEALDDKDFYITAKIADNLITRTSENKFTIIFIKEKLLMKIFNKSCLDKWFNAKELKAKRKKPEIEMSENFKTKAHIFMEAPNPKNLHLMISSVKSDLKCKYQRPELLSSLMSALNTSVHSKLSVYESMKNSRDLIRRNGRKISGKCIGTTLLTKGLEFDTVAILSADKFNCPKHLYVALTRACKKLVVFTKTNILKFNKAFC